MNLTHPVPSAPRRLLAALAAALPLAMLGAALPTQAAVMISQVYGGGGNANAPWLNDFVELHNSGPDAVNLTGWSLQYTSSTGTSWGNQKVNLSGSIPAGGYYLVKLGSGGSVGVALPTENAAGTFNMSASAGKLALVENTDNLTVSCPSGAAIRDLVGFGTAANCSETANTLAPSATQAVRRTVAGGSCADTGNNSTDFVLVTPNPRNTSITGACDVAGPASGGGGGGGGTTPPATTAASIAQIQGSGATSPLVGQTVITQGVVTKLANNGFYMQSQTPDADPATSEGIFVFTSSAPTTSVGRLVSVTGTVVEFATGGGTLTELSSPTVTDLGSGGSITPVVISLPVAHDLKLERYEGMLVTLQGPLTVSQTAFQAQYGQLTLSAGGRLQTPTNVYNPTSAGTQRTALAAANAARRITLDDGNSLTYPATTPFAAAVRAGYSVSSITGVIDYGPTTTSTTSGGDYRIVPLDNAAVSFSAGNARTLAPDAVGGNLRVAGANVLNYFTVFTNGNTASGQTGKGCTTSSGTSAGNCRGANSLAEFQRQQAKIVNMLAGLNADAVGLMEIQNRHNSVAADNALQNLVAALNARMGAGTYAAVADPAEGTGGDAIKVAMIYKPAKLSPVGAAVSDLDEVNNRPTLAQTFQLANGEKFMLVANHLKSKGSCGGAGSGDTDVGDGQGCWNATRVAQANRLRSFVAQRQAASGVSDVLMVGDFNAYAAEDPILALTSNGFVDQIARFQSFGYSYVFSGEAGRLDHAISSASLSPKVTGVTEWHINADESVAQDYNHEDKAPTDSNCGTDAAPRACPADPFDGSTPFRASDHDPVLVGLALFKTVQGTGGRDSLVGSAGDDQIIGGVGADTLTGGAGTNVFVYTSMRDSGDLITDFVPGKDWLDLRTLLAGLGWTGSNPVAEGWVRFAVSGTGTAVQIDADGPRGSGSWRTLTTLANVSPSAFVAQPSLIAR